MTISTEAAPLSYNGDDSVTPLPVTWKYFSKSDVVATHRDASDIETTWILDTDYTLTDAGVDSGGELTPTSTFAIGEKVVITLEPPNTQDKSIPIGGPFPSQNVEDGLDLAAQRDSKINETLDRGFRVPKTDTQTGSLLEIPIDSVRASKFLAFDANGKPIASTGPTGDSSIPVSSYIETLLDDEDAPTARATLDALQDVFTTLGDIIYEGVSSEARLAIENNKDVLRINSGIPSWKEKALFADEADILEKGFGLIPVKLIDPSTTATIAIDLNDGNYFTVRVDANFTIDNPTFLSEQSSGIFIIDLIFDNTGGWTSAFGSLFKTQQNSASIVTTADYIYRITFQLRPVHITGITKANPAVVTAKDHSLVNSDVVRIVNVGGMIEVNDLNFTVANRTADTFELTGIDSSVYTDYTNGGEAFLIDTYIERIG